MKILFTFVASVLRDGPIVGPGPHLRFRLDTGSTSAVTVPQRAVSHYLHERRVAASRWTPWRHSRPRRARWPMPAPRAKRARGQALDLMGLDDIGFHDDLTPVGVGNNRGKVDPDLYDWPSARFATPNGRLPDLLGRRFDWGDR